MVNRRGSVASGCLTLVLLLVIAVYIGVHAGAPYYRYYQFRDAVEQEARFAPMRSDSTIRQDIWANADTLALPDEAYHISIDRRPHAIHIHTSYDDSWSIATYRRPVHFTIDVRKPL